MREIPFESFNDRHAGATAIVVGKGPTTFDYARLARYAEPVFFINDSVALEQHLAPQQLSFMFAHDAIQSAWFERGIRTLPVLPIDGKVITGADDPALASLEHVVFYRWRTRAQDVVLQQTRDELARTRELYTDCGTIHSALHFVWYLGFKAVRFIGCDGLLPNPKLARLRDPATGYDKRIENATSSTPWGTFARIRKKQDRLCRRLKFQVEYLGTPATGLDLSRLPVLTRNLLIPRIDASGELGDGGHDGDGGRRA